MAADTYSLNLACDAIAGDVDQFALYEADPDGSSGTSNELTGGSYSRQGVSYDSASSGTAEISLSVEFGGPGTSTTVSHLGFWGGTSGDTWMGSVGLSTSKTVGSDDTLTITSAPISVS